MGLGGHPKPVDSPLWTAHGKGRFVSFGALLLDCDAATSPYTVTSDEFDRG